eukprot:11217091-Lingulodinium_polyedra.AAC.1
MLSLRGPWRPRALKEERDRWLPATRWKSSGTSPAGRQKGRPQCGAADAPFTESHGGSGGALSSG